MVPVLVRIPCRGSGNPLSPFLIVAGNRRVLGSNLLHIRGLRGNETQAIPVDHQTENMSKREELKVCRKKKNVSEGSKIMRELIL